MHYKVYTYIVIYVSSCILQDVGVGLDRNQADQLLIIHPSTKKL